MDEKTGTVEQTGTASTAGGGKGGPAIGTGSPANQPGGRADETGGAYKWVALIAIIMGTFVTVLNNSLINVALPKLVTVLNSTTQDIQWVLTGYMLASAVVIPMAGSLGDKFGYKRVFLLALGSFTATSLLCGLAWSDTSLIAFRILQGMSGGFIMPVGMSMIYMIMPREQIGTAIGLWGVAAMVAPAVGPTLSGYLIEYFSWRMLFFLNVPVSIFAVAMAALLLKETARKDELRFDVWGAVLSVIAFGTLLLALSKGQSEGWTSLYIVSLLFVAVFSLLLLVWVETGREQPLLELSLFRIPAFTFSTLSSGMVMIGLYGGVFLTPIYLQNLQGLSPVDTGLLLMPQSIAMALMMPISGRLFDRFGVMPVGLSGLTLLSVTTMYLHHLTLDTPNRWLETVLAVRGLGIGLCMMPLTTAGMNAVPRTLVGRASSLSNVFRQVMASLGIAVMTTIMTQRQAYYSAVIAESVTPDADPVGRTLVALGGYLAQGGLDPASAQGAALAIIAGLVQKEAAVRAIADTFFVSALPVAASLPLLYFLRKKRQEAPPAQG